MLKFIKNRINPSTKAKLWPWYAVYLKIIKYIEGIYSFLLRRGVSLLSTRAAADFKQSISPVTRVRHIEDHIVIHADSESEFNRAETLCGKEPETVAWIDQFIESGDVLYDIGANVGIFSLLACRRRRSTILVEAFEPSFATYHQLCRNVMLNGFQDQIRPHMIALGPETGISVFNYVSLKAGASMHSLGDPVLYSGEAFQPEFEQRVIGFNIDVLVSQFGFPVPNHIKLDVDGLELGILHGASQTLENEAVRSLIVEMSEGCKVSYQIPEYLEQKGFKSVGGRHHDDCDISNVIFAR